MTGKDNRPSPSQMPAGDLKAQVRHKVSAVSLNHEQLQQLEQRFGALMPGDTPQPAAKARAKYPLWTMVASICLLIAIGVSYWHYQAAPMRNAERIALEAAENHLHLMPLDVTSASMEQLQQYFTRLDFTLSPSALLAQSSARQQLLGGRYCSLGGKIASQLRYQQADHSMATLYQASYDPERFGRLPNINQGQSPKQITLKGLNVRVWVEQGLVMTLVEPLEPVEPRHETP